MQGNTVADVRTIERMLPEAARKCCVIWGDKSNGTKIPKTPRSHRGRPANCNAAEVQTHLSKAYALAQRLAVHGKWDAWGVGLALGHAEGVYALDLDHCRDAGSGELSPSAAKLVETFSTYTEVSPSGEGLRLLFLAAPGLAEGQPFLSALGVDAQIFATSGYVTLTGSSLHKPPRRARHILPSSPAARWVVTHLHPSGGDVSSNPPAFSDEVPETFAFLPGKDRSATLAAVAGDLTANGASPAKVLASLVNNPDTLRVALDHRQGDHDRAVQYLWQHHVVPTQGRASVSGDDFDQVDGPAPSGAFAFRPAPDLAGEARAPDWVVEGLVERGEVAFLTGDTGRGKTFVAYDLAAHVAAGRPWNGLAVTQGAVAYLCGEGRNGFRRRVHGFAKHRFDPGPALVIAQDILDLASAEQRQVLHKALPDNLRLLVVDTLSRYSSAEENDNKEMANLLVQMQAIAKQWDCAVLILHHPRKDDPTGEPRGAGALRMNADVVMTVQEWQDQFNRLQVTTARDTGKAFDLVYDLEVVQVGPWSTCVIAPLPGAQREAIIRDVEDEQRMRVLRVLDVQWRGLRAIVVPGMNEDDKRAVLDDLAALALVTVHERPDRKRWMLSPAGQARLDGEVLL